MTLQCSGWWHIGRDGRTGPEVTEKMRFAGSTSRRLLERGGVGGRTPFEGVVVLFRGARRGRGTRVLTVYFGTPNMFITLWFGFDYGLTLH
jgi:hypothetical protein